MKIAYLTNDMDPKNGGGRFAFDLITGVKKAGHGVIVLKEKDDGQEGVNILKRGLCLFTSAVKARRYLKDCDIIHALDVYPYGIIAYIAGIFLKKKLIITVQGTYSISPFYNIKTRFLSKMACRRADAITSISNYTKNELLKQLKKCKRLEVVNHGIDLNKFYTERAGSNGVYVLSVGALKHRKGYHVSIPAFALAKQTITGLKYKIVGSQRDIGYFRKLKELAKEYGVQNDVEFLHNVSDSDLRRLYASARCFVLASVNDGHHFEGFGLVFLEAAAAGLPVIGTSGNGIEDALKDGYNGLLVPQNDAKKTAAAILEVSGDSQQWQAMNRASYDWAKTHDSASMVNKYLGVYNSLIK